MKNKSILNKMDKPLLILTLLYACLGVLLVLSASSVAAVLKYNVGPYHFFIRQLIFYIISFSIGFILIIRVPTKSYKKIVFPVLTVLIIVLIFLLMYGNLTNNAKSWINLGFFSFQPSEFIKLVLILYLGVFFGSDESKRSGKYSFLIPIMFSFIVFVLVALQPDFGTASVIACIVFFSFLSIPFNKNTLAKISKIAALSLAILLIVLLVSNTSFLTETQRKRFIFKEPCTRYIEETGYQACNGFIAMNGGGLLGKGIGQSTQKYLYLPEAHTDFIFPIAVEELGVIFGIALILGYIYMLYRIMKIAKSCYSLQNSIICFGVLIYVLCHLIINLGGILALVPLTGIPLPFLSQGGSFTITLVFAMFVVQRINIENKILQKNIEISHIAKK